MLKEWIRLCEEMACTETSFVSGARKIIRPVQYIMNPSRHRIELADCGYTAHKMAHLKRLYLHQESLDTAVQLWHRRLEQNRYGSVGFTCYNHFIKTDPEKSSKRTSIMGPCLQSVTLTHLPDKSTGIDIFYRTTELFKKFPADLVFLQDILLPPFDLDNIDSLTFHFANVTVHPMYYVTIIPHQKNPLDQLRTIKHRDPWLHKWVVKWTARYFIKKYRKGIEKFSQGMRVHKDANERVSSKVKEVLIPYLKENYE